MEQPLDQKKSFDFFGDYNGHKIPYLAFSFIDGENLDHPFYDESYFTISLQQINQTSTGKTYINMPMKQCTKDQQDWTKQDLTLYCPDQNLGTRGVLGQSDNYDYFRIVIKGCVDKEGSVKCQSNADIKVQLGHGRFFVYLFKPASKNYKTQEEIGSSVQIYQYFLVQDFYNREEIVLQDR